MSFLCLVDTIYTIVSSEKNFVVKIFKLLKIVIYNRTPIEQVGCCWCKDGEHFICNSRILGKCMNLKPNSINKNFKLYSFESEHISSKEIIKYFGNLPDIKNWKLMKIKSPYHFSINCTETEIENIPKNIHTNIHTNTNSHIFPEEQKIMNSPQNNSTNNDNNNNNNNNNNLQKIKADQENVKSIVSNQENQENNENNLLNSFFDVNDFNDLDNFSIFGNFSNFEINDDFENQNEDEQDISINNDLYKMMYE